MNLDPVRQVRLARARAEAERLLAQARDEAAETVAAAHSEAETTVAEARRQGSRDAAVENEGSGSESARAAREAVLAARREACDSLARTAEAAVLALRENPAYPRLLEALRAAALAQLGPGASVELDPRRYGGVIARAGHRRVDYTLPVLAQRCVDALGPRIEELWR